MKSIVLDTNVALDLLVFDDPACQPLREALAAGDLRWIATAAMRGELARVLSYPLILARLERVERVERTSAQVLMAFDAQVHQVEAPPEPASCTCEDPDDQVFIDLAVAHGARLLSKDRAVLVMHRQLESLGVPVAAQYLP